jgi:hypothetical protein
MCHTCAEPHFSLNENGPKRHPCPLNIAEGLFRQLRTGPTFTWGQDLPINYGKDDFAVLENHAVSRSVGTLVSFRVGHTDAEVLESEYARSFIARQFVELDTHQVLVRLLENGAAREPFRATTLPPLVNLVGRREKLIAHSRQRYAVPRQTVESRLKRCAEN